MAEKCLRITLELMAIKTKNKIKAVLIPAVAEYFLDKDAAWFSANLPRLKKMRGVSGFWQKNTLYLQKDQKISPYTVLRDLAEAGYEKVQRIENPGEFTALGDTIRIYALGLSQIITLEFWGNYLESIHQTRPAVRPVSPSHRRRLEQKMQERFLKKLEPGDYIVHLDHGVAILKGKIQLPASAAVRGQTPHGSITYFRLGYAKGDELLVPISRTDKLSPYIGFGAPRIHRLGGSFWQRTKRQARKSTVELAKKLLKIYAQRQVKTRPPYAPDDELQKQFESAFPYQLTIDQEQALQEIKQDMASPHPMDRLLIGDVGFGKTEVALRAAYKAILSGRQAAMLVPTTILADQHFRNFKQRFRQTSVKLGLISRAVPQSSRERVLVKAKTGEIDLLVGTHGLLNPQLQFKNLGLLIIDEEQKFGVEAKEKFKENYPLLDVLSLSATPIPRSLQLALSNVWDASLLLSPPPLKKKIKTYIAEFKPERAVQAIEKELKRGGQVYWLYNKIHSINRAKEAIQKLLPEVRVEIAHGRLPEKKLIKIMRAFARKEFDVLLATTIIENGLDLPQVNTLIVQEAEKLGLSQAHQIRGRIGRKQKQARAYFFYNPQQVTEAGQKRLRLLKRFSDLGEGYELSLKDLEMRGGGNILGAQQSGHIRAIGLNLYSQMLSEAVEQLKTNPHPNPPPMK